MTKSDFLAEANPECWYYVWVYDEAETFLAQWYPGHNSFFEAVAPCDIDLLEEITEMVRDGLVFTPDELLGAPIGELN